MNQKILFILLALFLSVNAQNTQKPTRYVITGNDWSFLNNELNLSEANIAISMPNKNSIAAYIPIGHIERLKNNRNLHVYEDTIYNYPDHIAIESIQTTSIETIPFGIHMVQADIDRFGKGTNDQLTTVCIVDSGHDSSHEDLPSGVTSINRGETDGCGHGTHVMGTIAAITGNGFGVRGIVNPKLKVVKVFGDDCSWVWGSSLINAIQNCIDPTSKVVVNLSLGSYQGSVWEQEQFQLLSDQGLVIIAAAGNGGNDPRVRKKAHYPASYDSVISVAAVDENKIQAYFSQENNDVELSAPGVSILSTVPGNAYAYYSGTSMATPHVVGVVARLLANVTNADGTAVRIALQRTAEDLGTVGRDKEYGFGLIQGADALDFLHNCVPTESTESNCNDGLDNDCDGVIDSTDPDCSSSGSGGCNLLQKGESCIIDSECCSNSCKGRSGRKTCK